MAWSVFIDRNGSETIELDVFIGFTLAPAHTGAFCLSTGDLGLGQFSDTPQEAARGVIWNKGLTMLGRCVDQIAEVVDIALATQSCNGAKLSISPQCATRRLWARSIATSLSSEKGGIERVLQFIHALILRPPFNPPTRIAFGFVIEDGRMTGLSNAAQLAGDAVPNVRNLGDAAHALATVATVSGLSPGDRSYPV